MTIKVPVMGPEQLPALDAWLRAVLWDAVLPLPGPAASQAGYKFEIHRLKAKIPLSNGEIKIVQGVREIFDILDAPGGAEAGSVAALQGKLVLIGRHLGDIPFEESLSSAIESS